MDERKGGTRDFLGLGRTERFGYPLHEGRLACAEVAAQYEQNGGLERGRKLAANPHRFFG
jgi:hypothetical protein